MRTVNAKQKIQIFNALGILAILAGVALAALSTSSNCGWCSKDHGMFSDRG